jgi:hypothetical protein
MPAAESRCSINSGDHNAGVDDDMVCPAWSAGSDDGGAALAGSPEPPSAGPPISATPIDADIERHSATVMTDVVSSR